jgi:hypothetical protein
MRSHLKTWRSPLRTLFRIGAITLLALCTTWAADPLIQPEDVSQLAEGKLYISNHNHLQRVRLSPNAWQATNDGGRSWTPLTAPFAARNAVRIAFHPEGKTQLFASSDHGDAAYFDGASWWPVPLPEESVLIGGSAPPVLLQSLSSAGHTTTRLLLGTPRGLRFANLAHAEGAVAPNCSESIFWQTAKVSTLPVTALALSASGHRVAIGYASGHVAVLEGDPAIPTLVSASLPRAEKVLSVAFHPVNEADLLATFAPSANSLTRSVHHSLDAGERWVALALPQQAISDTLALRLALPDGAHSLLASVHSLVTLRDNELLAAQQNPAQAIGRVTAAHQVLTRQGEVSHNDPSPARNIVPIAAGNKGKDSCAVLSAAPLSLPAAGGQVLITLRLTKDCGEAVKLSSTSPFVQVPTGKVKSSTITLTVAPNTAFQDRFATVTISEDKRGPKDEIINKGTINLRQNAAIPPCKLTLTTQGTHFRYEGGTGVVSATTTGNCPAGRELQLRASDLQFGYTGPFPATSPIRFTVPANMPPPHDPFRLTPARSFEIYARLITADGPYLESRLTITQDAFQLPAENLCVQDSELMLRNIDMSPGEVRVERFAVNTGPYCRWNVQDAGTLDPVKGWISLSTNNNNIGPGSVIAQVSEITQRSRSGFFLIAGRRGRVYSEGLSKTYGCSSVVANLDDAAPVSAVGGARELLITAPPRCQYTISLSGDTSTAVLLDPTEGVADGRLRLNIPKNATGKPRSLSFQLNHSGPPTSVVTLTQQ